MAAVSASDLKAGQLICLLDRERRVLSVHQEDASIQWTLRPGLVLGSLVHEGKIESQSGRYVFEAIMTRFLVGFQTDSDCLLFLLKLSL